MLRNHCFKSSNYLPPPFYFHYRYWQLVVFCLHFHPICPTALKLQVHVPQAVRPNNTKALEFGTEKGLLRAMQGDRRRQWNPTPVLLLGKSHGQRSLLGCSPWGREESDTTERLYFHFSLSCIGEGNGNPLQCSCLENPRDRGAWWTAVYGVAQS